MNAARPLGLGERIWCLFFPARCLKCGKAVRPERYFCRECAASLPEGPLRREFPLPGEDGEFLEVAAALPNEGEFRHTLYRLKFQEEWGLAKPLGQLMAQTVPEGEAPFDGVVWVPMSSKKLRQRGYNQSELLARALANELGLPAWELLSQVRETQTQHTLTRVQRADNVRDAYRAGKAALGKRLLLVDDIVTTGATLRACSLALYQAGARWVCGMCAASTPVEPGKELPREEL